MTAPVRPIAIRFRGERNCIDFRSGQNLLCDLFRFLGGVIHAFLLSFDDVFE